MKLSEFITRRLILAQVGRHPDCTAVDTWKEPQALVDYHGNLWITLSVMSRN